jgi:hypothetical protein
MDIGDYDPDPFSSESLWRLSRFSIEALQPLESLPWNADLPGTYAAQTIGASGLPIADSSCL